MINYNFIKKNLTILILLCLTLLPLTIQAKESNKIYAYFNIRYNHISSIINQLKLINLSRY